MEPPTTSTFPLFFTACVRWADVDMQKIVFNAHYLTYFDTAMGDYWRALALPYDSTLQALGGDLYVKKATIEYHASAQMERSIGGGAAMPTHWHLVHDL